MQRLLTDWCVSDRITSESVRQGIEFAVHHLLTAALIRHGRADMHLGVEL